MDDGYRRTMDTVSASDAATLQFYQTNARSYLEARPATASPDLLAFLPRLKAGSSILELGCGGGDDALAIERLGFRVDATDGVAAMAAIAGRRLARGARVLRFDQLDATDRFDAVVACASLLHVPAAELSAVIGRVWRALKPAGWHFASFKTAASPGRDRFGRYYNYPDEARAHEMYRSAGQWAALAFDSYEGAGCCSEPARWLTVIAQKDGRATGGIAT